MQRLVGGALLVLALGQLVLERRHLGHQRAGLRLVFGALRPADLPRGRIAPRLGLLQARDDLAAGLIQMGQLARELHVPAGRDASLPEPRVERLRIVPDPLDIEHRPRLSRECDCSWCAVV